MKSPSQPTFEGTELVVRDERDGSALPWWNVRVQLAGGAIATVRPDSKGVIRWKDSKSIESVAVEFGSDGTPYSLANCTLEKAPDGQIVASAPFLFVGRFLAVAPGLDPAKDVRIQRVQSLRADGAGVPFQFTTPRLEVGAEPDERVFAIATLRRMQHDLAELGATLEVTLGSGEENSATWSAKFPVPGLVTSPVVQLESSSTASLRVLVLDDTTSQPLPGAIVAVATPESHAKSRVDASTLTDAEGHVVHANLKAGKYHIFVRSIGFKDRREVVQVAAGEPEHVVRLVPRATLHDYEVNVALPAGADLSKFRVVVNCEPMFVLLDVAVEPTPGGTSAVARFQRLPAGEYTVKVLELGDETKVRGEQVTLVPGSLRCDFNLRGWPGGGGAALAGEEGGRSRGR
ncbi:MAG: carboxypeptidase regulatory-like domain-containing protein [Planctomycetota bacterium]|nr:carboxypeptidase regulatory-like domain-containing protein [Planctomycetota bacterium]